MLVAARPSRSCFSPADLRPSPRARAFPRWNASTKAAEEERAGAARVAAAKREQAARDRLAARRRRRPLLPAPLCGKHA